MSIYYNQRIIKLKIASKSKCYEYKPFISLEGHIHKLLRMETVIFEKFISNGTYIDRQANFVGFWYWNSKEFKVFNLKTGACHTLESFSNVNKICISEGGQTIIAVGADNSMSIYTKQKDGRYQVELSEIQGAHSVKSCDISPNSEFVCVACRDIKNPYQGFIRVVNIRRNKHFDIRNLDGEIADVRMRKEPHTGKCILVFSIRNAKSQNSEIFTYQFLDTMDYGTFKFDEKNLTLLHKEPGNLTVPSFDVTDDSEEIVIQSARKDERDDQWNSFSIYKRNPNKLREISFDKAENQTATYFSNIRKEKTSHPICAACKIDLQHFFYFSGYSGINVFGMQSIVSENFKNFHYGSDIIDVEVKAKGNYLIAALTTRKGFIRIDKHKI